MLEFKLRLFALALSSFCLSLPNCTVAPEIGDKPVTKALERPKSGKVVKTAKKLEAGRKPEHSSFLLLEENKEALEWRLALIDEARSSIDIQLYLWHSGSASRILFDRVLRAADRGVRVRLLVDDFLLASNEKDIAVLCRHQPNLDIRIFNPTRLRGNPLGSAAEFILNFQHLNRRMHNKTWTVDRAFSIVGGRNVGDHYFGLDKKYNFLDLDVLVSGPVVEEISSGFDLFWNSAQAYPGSKFSDRGSARDVAVIRQELREDLVAEKEGQLRSFPTMPRDWSNEFSRLPDLMEEGRARFLQDHPDLTKDTRTVVKGLTDMTRNQEGEIIIISPYLIPSDDAIVRLQEGVDEGVKVGILAPSLAANNQAAAHGHYRKKRKGIVKAGAHLFELRGNPSESLRAMVDVDPVRSKEVALHAKAVVGDRERCFIGSLNLDPRAMAINTESGLLIDSPEISNELLELAREVVATDAWEVTLDEKEKLTWSSKGEKRHKPPPARFFKRMMAVVVGWLPIESQL